MAKKKTNPPAAAAKGDLDALLGRFSDARCVLECAVRSLEQWQDLTEPDASRSTCDDEIVCLRHALLLLSGIYDELDSAISNAHSKA